MIERWPRDMWLEAMWDSEDPALKPAERQMAYVYARFAGKQDVSWVKDKEMARRTGIRSRDTFNKTRRTLIETGWLVEVDAPHGQQSGVYRMVIPESEQEMRRPEKPSDR